MWKYENLKDGSTYFQFADYSSDIPLNSSSIFNRCHSLCKVIVFSPISPLHLCLGKHSQFLPTQHFKFSSIKTSMRRAACNWKLAEVSLDIIYWKTILESGPNLGDKDHIHRRGSQNLERKVILILADLPPWNHGRKRCSLNPENWLWNTKFSKKMDTKVLEEQS